MILTEIIEAAGADIRPRSGSDDEVYLCCPFCEENGESADSRFRLGLNIRTGSAHCFNCGFKAKGLMYTARQLCRGYDIKMNLRGILAKERKNKAVVKKKTMVRLVPRGLPDEYEKFTQSGDSLERRARKYLRARGVSTLQIVKHEIGFAGSGDLAYRILFPVKDKDGCVYGCVGRDFSGVRKPKYLNTPGMKLLWNAHRRATTAVVVEGVFDALAVETALLRTRDVIAVSRLGSAITSHQLDQLYAFENVVIFPDADRPGIQGAMDLCDRCSHRTGISVWIPPVLTGRDPGSMSEEEIMECIKDAVPWDKSAERKLRAVASRDEGLDD